MPESKRIVDAETGKTISSTRVGAALGIAFSTFILYKMLNSGVYHGSSRGRIFNIYADDTLFYLMLPLMVIILLGSIWAFGQTLADFSTTHALAGVLGITALLALTTSDPSAKYSTEEYWQAASIEDVSDVPESALEWGNKNGSVLMWAAAGTDDPRVLTALINRGADINESDEIYGGTALSAAAIETSNPAIIDVLVAHGAMVNRIIGKYDKSPLLLAAELNKNPQVLERLIAHGAKLTYKDKLGNSALDMAKRTNNTAVQPLLEELYSSLEDH